MRIVGVNGIASHGEHNIDILLARLALAGHETIDVPLPKRHFVSAWWGHKEDAEAIADFSQDGDIIIGHSFGGPRVAEAMMHRNYRQIFFIRPAMSKHYVFNRKGVYCFHSKQDWPVRVGALLPFHPFGKAGVDGFTDPCVKNIRSYGGHNADFDERLDMTVWHIENYVKNGP